MAKVKLSAIYVPNMKNRKQLIYLWALFILHSGAFAQNTPGNYQFTTTFSDSLSSPVRLAIDQNDHIYVTDSYRKEILHYNPAGIFVGKTATLFSPVSIALNHSGEIFTGDGVSGFIYRISANGAVVPFYQSAVFPSSMTFGSDGMLYVSDSKLQRILVINPSGNLVRTIGEGILLYPTGIAFDKKNNRILVAEHGGIGTGFNPVIKIRIFSLAGTLLNSFGSNGNSDGKFYRIQGITVGRCGEIYVPEPYQGNVSVFNENTTFASRFAAYGDSTGQLRVPLDVAVNSQDQLFITAENNGEISVFNVSYLLPTSNITGGNQTICSGNSAWIPVHLTGIPPWSFTYTVNDINPMTIQNITSSPYQLSAMLAGNYKITALSDSVHAGTCFSGSAMIMINNQYPTADFIGDSIGLCPGSTASIQVNLTGIPPWSINITRNGLSPVTFQQINTTPFEFPVSEAGVYSISSISGGSCDGIPSTGTMTVYNQELPSARITEGVVNACSGSTAVIPVNFTGTPPWNFTYQLNGIIKEPVTGIVDNPFLWSLSEPGTYTLTGVQDFQCESIISGVSVQVNHYPWPSATLSSGNFSFCAGDSALIPVSFSGTAPYILSWSVNDQNIQTLSGITDNPFYLPAKVQGICKLTAVSDANGCQAGAVSGLASVSEIPLPQISLPSRLSICPGDSVILDPGPHVFYFWNDSTTTRRNTAFSAGTYSVSVTDYSGCSAIGSSIIGYKPAPTATLESGSVNLCPGTSASLTIELTGLPPWNVDLKLNSVTVQALQNILTTPVNPLVQQPGQYTIANVSDANCSSGSSGGQFTSTEHPLPGCNFGSGVENFCPGGTARLKLNLTGTPPWNVKIVRNGTDTLHLNNLNTSPAEFEVTETGSYRLASVSDAVCTRYGLNANCIVRENPAPVVNLGPDLLVPAGAGYILDASSSFASYLWSNGSTGQNLSVTETGLYRVTITDFNGCTASDGVNITFTEVPLNYQAGGQIITNYQCINALQTITVAGDGQVFEVRAGGNATFIAGNNILFLSGTQVDSGGYLHGYIAVDNNFCGTMPASMISVSHNGTVEKFPAPVIADNLFKIYPNPTTGIIHIENKSLIHKEFMVIILDIPGHVINSFMNDGDKPTVSCDIGPHPPGIYTLKITSGTWVKTFKIVLMSVY